MFSKIIIAILTIAISVANLHAEEVSKTQEALKYVKEKFEFAYHGEYYVVHDPDNKLKDFKHMQMPILTYRPFKNIKLNSLAEFKYADRPDAAYTNRYYRSLFTLTLENVLTEKENGFKMDVGIARRVYDRKSFPNTYGNSRVFASFSRNIPGGSGKNTASLLTQYLLNDTKNISASTWEHSIELIPVVSLQLMDNLSFALQDDFTFYTSKLSSNPRKTQIGHEAYATFTLKLMDKLSPYLQFRYVHGDSFKATEAGKHQNSDEIAYFIGAGYNLTSKITLTPEIGNVATTSSDDKVIADTFKYIDLALYVDISF